MGSVAAGLAALLLVPAALAAHPGRGWRSHVNLDHDAALEQVVFSEVPNVSHTAQNAGMWIVDRCHGRERRYAYSPTGTFERLRQRRVEEADGHTRRPEVFVDVWSARGEGGLVALVRLDGGRRGCARPRALFLYRSDRPLTAPPAGQSVVDFDVELADFPHGARGKEIRLTESYSNGDGVATFFRYEPFRQRYVEYAFQKP